VAIVGSAGWVTLEWVRGQFLLGGFPWNFLGASQHQAVPLIQFASVTGVYGVSAFVCFVNFAFFFTVRRFVRQMRDKIPLRRLSYEFYLAMGLVCAALLHGMREIRRGEPDRTLRLALVQGNIPQTLKFVPGERPMILERYRTLTQQTLADEPDLIIWPETATPDALRYDPESFALVTNLAALANAYLLTGTIDMTPYSSPPEAFNAAILVRPDGALVNIYHKLHLVPFGEYVPLRKILPFMKWLTPIQDSFERGREFTVFALEGRASARPFDEAASRKRGPPNESIRFGAVICFEDTVPELYRQFVRRGVDFMVNLTNDAWFKESPAAELHLANAIFRTVETRRPLVRATNNGVTCIVDEFGFVRERLEPFAARSAVWELPLSGRTDLTFYAQHGDAFVALCAIVSGVAAFWWLRRRP
jgi:apolipoprotein N-acyltransferase